MSGVLSRYSKATGALLGSLTPAVVVTIAALVGVHVDPILATGICTVCGTLATILAPPNVPAPVVPPPAPPQA